MFADNLFYNIKIQLFKNTMPQQQLSVQ